MTPAERSAVLEEAAQDALVHGVGAVRITPGEVIYVPAGDLLAKPPHDAAAAFAEWFRENYPGPDTIIHDPDWHAPRIFRAVIRALKQQEPTA